MLGLGSSLLHPSGHEQLYSVSFDGTDDYITLGDVLDLGTADFSMSCWVKLADVTNKYLFSKHQGDDDNIWVYFAVEKIAATAKGGGNIVCNHQGANNMTALQNTWIHICVSWDRSANGAVYVNGTTTTYGKALHDLTSDTQTLNNTGDWEFMKYSTAYTAGKMTDVAMWNVALDAGAVTAIYNSGKPFDLTSDRGSYVNSSALQGYWKMNDGSGTTVVDSVGSNNGTISGATWSTDTPDD